MIQKLVQSVLLALLVKEPHASILSLLIHVQTSGSGIIVQAKDVLKFHKLVIPLIKLQVIV